ncbi:MAG: hypothetical protein M1822_000848 [Bathelium mastoideum]|nr:MAG: hypothetical protein M1822_000848 [Bathelium mastoideum]
MTAGSFTEKDMRNLALGWQCIVGGEPAIDYDKFAKLAGYTEGSARTTWGTLRRKVKTLGEEATSGVSNSNGNDNGKGAPSTPTTPGTGKKRGRKTAGTEDGEGASPEKKARKPRKSKAQKMAEEEESRALLEKAAKAASEEAESDAVKMEGDDEDELVKPEDYDGDMDDLEEIIA